MDSAESRDYAVLVIRLTLALSAGVYALGLLGSLPDAFASPIWPATGFQIAMYFRFGSKAIWAMTPGILAIQFQLGVQGGMAMLPAVLFAVFSWSAMATEAVIARWLARPSPDGSLGREAFIRFAIFGAPLGTLSSALQGVTVLAIYDAYPAEIAWYVPYVVWWSGNLIGAYALVPLLVLSRADLGALRRDWRTAVLSLATTLTLVGILQLSDSRDQSELAALGLVLLLYLIVRHLNYSTLVVSLSLGALWLILLRVTDHTVDAVADSIQGLFILKMEIAFVLVAAIAVFRQQESNQSLTRQVMDDVQLLQERVLERTEALSREVETRRRAEASATGTNKLLSAVGQVRADLIEDGDPFKGYGSLLETLLELTESEYGFVGDLHRHPSTGKPYLKMYAISNLAWDDQTRALYESLRRDQFEFSTMDNLIGEVVKTDEPVLSACPATDVRSGGMPPGHPQIDTFVGIPVRYARKMVGEIGLANRPGGYDQIFLERLDPVVEAVGQLIRARQDREAREKAEAELHRISMTDPLTDLPNRRYMEPELQKVLKRAERHTFPVCLLMMDLDRFKAVNDEHGHEAGDAVLRQVADVLRGAVRDIDHVARWGGEEFLLLATHTTLGAGVDLAERIRQRMEQHVFPAPKHVTVSIGVAQWRPDEDVKSFIARTDAALYAAKASGRNCVEMASTPLS